MDAHDPSVPPGGRRRRHDAARPRALRGTLAVLIAAAPAVAALACAIAAGVDPSPVVRLLVVAVVFAPVAVLAVSYRRPGVAAICGSLSVLSGWLGLVIVLGRIAGSPALDAVQLVLLHLARLPELAALAVLPWLVARDQRHRWHAGIAFGSGAVVCDAVLSLTSPLIPHVAWLGLTPFLWALISLVAGTAALARRWRGGDRRERAALVWFAAGIALVLLSYGRLVVAYPPPVAVLGDAAFAFAQAALPIGIVATIARQGPPPERRTLDVIAWAQALTLAVGAYLLFTAAARGLGVDPMLGGAFAAGALALVLGGAIEPLRAHLAQLLDLTAPDARAVLGSLGRGLAVDGAPGDVRRLATSLRATWDLSCVEIALEPPAGAVRDGAPGAHAVSAPLIAGARTIGTITLSGPSRTSLEAIVRPVLEQTAGLIAVAVLLATVNEDVASTRRRTLDVRREERRLMHGELHDQLAPSLAGAGFAIAAAETLLATGDPRAGSAIEAVRDQITHCTEDVRRLARALLPTALDQGDLEGALVELAANATESGVTTRIDAHGSDVLDADLQLGVYLALAEAIALARRGRAEGIRASISIADDGIRVIVRASGPPAATKGIAVALRRRAEELGGTAIDAEDGFEAVIPR